MLSILVKESISSLKSFFWRFLSSILQFIQIIINLIFSPESYFILEPAMTFTPKQNKWSLLTPKRSIRRHHRWRMVQKASRSQMLRNHPPERRLHAARRWADQLKICSCELGCGNSRRNGWYSQSARLTKQEHRSNDDFNHQLEELIYLNDFEDI